MSELYNLGISEYDLKNILEINPDLKNISNSEVKDKINILLDINCTKKDIINIITCNSYFLTKSNEDIILLINRLTDLGFTTLNLLIEANPFILNLDAYEIDNYINKRLSNNELLEDIIDDLDSKPYLFSEF